MGSVLRTHPDAAVLLEDSLTVILQATQTLVSVRRVPEEADRLALFGVPKSFISHDYNSVSRELEQLADIDGYKYRFEAVFRSLMLLACDRTSASLFGAKSTLAMSWEDLDYLHSVLKDLRLILIIRNPINVIASSLRRRDAAKRGQDVWHINSVGEAVCEWKSAMRTIRRVVQDSTCPVYVVKYEELCSSRLEAEKVLDFCGLSQDGERPDLWHRPVGETRSSLSLAELAYLAFHFPRCDEIWRENCYQRLLWIYG